MKKIPIKLNEILYPLEMYSTPMSKDAQLLATAKDGIR